MVTADTPDRIQPLTRPLPCWHESLHAARTDAIVAASTRRARIATDRPVPVGMPVYLELGPDAGIDAVAVQVDDDAFVVEFITVDDTAAAVLREARAADTPSTAAPSSLPRARTDELLAAVGGPPAGPTPSGAAPDEVGEHATPPAPAAVLDPIAAKPVTAVDERGAVAAAIIRTGDFIVVAPPDAPPPPPSHAASPTAADEPIPRTGEFVVPTPPPQAPAHAATAVDEPILRTGEFVAPTTPATPPPGPAHDATADDDEPILRTGEFVAPTTPATPPGPAHDEPAQQTGGLVAPTTPDTPPPGAAHADTAADESILRTGEFVVVTPAAPPAGGRGAGGPAWARALDADLGDEPEGSAVEHTQRWPTARLASSEPEAPPTAVEETERWPVARVAVQVGTTPPPPPVVVAQPAANEPPPPSAADRPSTPTTVDAVDETARWPVARVAAAPTPSPNAPATAPPMALDDGEDVILEFTAPPRPVAARPLPPPEPDGVVEVDFSEFQDVLGVATFRAEGAATPLRENRISTPRPISISLPRTPSSSLQPVVEPRNPFAGDSGVGPRPDSTPPTPPPADAPPAAEQWVVSSSPSLPAPRLLDRGLDRVLRTGGGANSATPKPLPFHDSTPSAPPLPLDLPPLPASTTTSSPPAPTTTVPPTPTTTPPTTSSLTPRVVPAARSPFSVPPVSPVVAPRPPAVVPVVVPPRPAVPASLVPRPASPPVGGATTPPAAGPLPSKATPAEAFNGSAHVLPLTPSAEGLPIIVGDDDT